MQIHVDRYKYLVYRHLEADPYLKTIVTRDETSTRFHACERFDRCKQVEVDGRASHTRAGYHVVYVNPVTMSTTAWQEYLEDTRKRLRGGEEINNLVRHGPKIDMIFSLKSIHSFIASTAISTLPSARAAFFRVSI